MHPLKAQLSGSPRRPYRRFLAAALILTLTVLAAGCERMAGTYQAQGDSRDTIEFKGDKVYITISPAPTMVGEYEIDDDKVILTIEGSGGQHLVLTRKGDSLEGAPFGKVFVKQ